MDLPCPNAGGATTVPVAGTEILRKFFLKCADAITSRRGLSPPRETAMSQEPPEKMMFQLTLRRRGVSDQAGLRTMEEVPRAGFVAACGRRHAHWRRGLRSALR